jgi:hypothetical protein
LRLAVKEEADETAFEDEAATEFVSTIPLF